MILILKIRLNSSPIKRTNALALTFRGTRTESASKVELEEYLLHLVPLVIEHPKILLSESKNLSQTMSKLYRASSDFIGDASLSVEQRSTLKVKSLCLPTILISRRPLGTRSTRGR
jgi:hypothetical protein